VVANAEAAQFARAYFESLRVQERGEFAEAVGGFGVSNHVMKEVEFPPAGVADMGLSNGAGRVQMKEQGSEKKVVNEPWAVVFQSALHVKKCGMEKGQAREGEPTSEASSGGVRRTARSAGRPFITSFAGGGCGCNRIRMGAPERGRATGFAPSVCEQEGTGVEVP
jgi:hypothetical protein